RQLIACRHADILTTESQRAQRKAQRCVECAVTVSSGSHCVAYGKVLDGFRGPDTPVRQGEAFSWPCRIFIISPRREASCLGRITNYGRGAVRFAKPDKSVRPTVRDAPITPETYAIQ